jgi:hypothetical protein
MPRGIREISPISDEMDMISPSSRFDAPMSTMNNG